MDLKSVTSAIRNLREHIGRTGEKKEKLSQSEFGEKYLGIKIATLQRYEKHGPPLLQLVTLARVSEEHGRLDLAEIFREAAINTVPAQVRVWISGSTSPAIVPKRKRA